MNTLNVFVRRGILLGTLTRPQTAASSMVQRRLESTEIVAGGRAPFRVKLKSGKRYAWCACGHSKKQVHKEIQKYCECFSNEEPFCDGAHRAKAPSIEPLRFTPEKDRTVLLCACKQTKNRPYCDGSHIKLLFNDAVNYVKGVFKK